VKQFIIRSLLLNALGTPLFLIYLRINQRTGIEHHIVEMPEWVPFWPLMTIPYLLMLIVPWLGALTLTENRNFYQYLISASLSFLIIGSIWHFHPTEMARPATPDGALYQIHRILIANDHPVCIVPCGHVIGPIAITCLLGLERPRWLYWMLPLLGFGIISIATTWQHRPLDIVTGSILCLSSVLATRQLFKRLIPGQAQC
jgi:hypothetical protein